LFDVGPLFARRPDLFCATIMPLIAKLGLNGYQVLDTSKGADVEERLGSQPRS
jgi:hypothetical protein